ncbi:MAG: hemerythrin domain-containing protein [Proteobacteria bacterium]|nr:hemerythrin domain-containing protein [Pseudomonadota bacterium]
MNSTLLQALYEDHIRQRQLLDKIETELRKFGDDHAVPDLELIVLALKYCVDYPARYHHPVEDVLYARILEKQPGLRDTLDKALQDHEVLARLTASFATAMAEMIGGAPRYKALAAGERFISMFRRHMETEETKLFPSARDSLTPEDWDSIDAELKLPDDPLFGENIRDAYLALHRRVLAGSR